MKTTKRNQRPNRKIYERTETTPRRERERARDPEVGAFTTTLERNTEQTLTLPPQKFPLCIHTHLIKHRRAKAKEKKERQNRERFISKRSFYSLLVSSRWYSALSNARLLKLLKLFHFGQHDFGHVGKFLRSTRGV